MKTTKLVVATRFISGVYAFSAGLMALGSPWTRVLFTAAMSVLWLILAEKTHKGTITLKSMVNLFLALAAVYLMTAVDYFMDKHYFFAGCHGLAFIGTLGVALFINYRFARK